MGLYWGVTLHNEDSTIELSKSSHYIEEGTTVTLKANDGYVIKSIRLETPHYTEQVTDGNGLNEFKFRPRQYIKDTVTTKKLDIYVTTEEVEVGQVVTLSLDLDSGFTTDFTKEVVEKTDVVQIDLKDYHKFFGNVIVTLNDTVHEYNYQDNSFYFRNDGKSFALRLETKWKEDLESVSIEAHSEKYTAYSTQLENAVSNIYRNEVDSKDQLIVSAKEGYEFNESGITIVYTRNGVNERITYKPKQYPDLFDSEGQEFIQKFTLDFGTVWSDDLQEIEVIALAEEPPPPRETILNLVLENATANIEGNRINEIQDLVLTANEGFEFKDQIKMTLTRQLNVAITKTFFPNSVTDSKYFNEDNTVFTLNMSEIWKHDLQILLIESSAEETYTGGDDEDITDSTTDFANVYHADSSILSSISAERFSKSQTGGTEGQGDLNIDMGAYIYQAYKFPLKFTADLISESVSKVQMGFYDLETTSKYMLRSRVKFDLGTIQVPESYHNIYDYRDTQCLLHVPYAEPIEIEPTYVIGQMVDLTYFLDLYNGVVTLEVYSDKIEGGLVQRVDNLPLAFDIPFIQPTYNSVSNKVGGYISNKVKTPYIEVVRNIPYDVSTIFGKEGKEYGQLQTFEGYIEVSDLDIYTTASRSEQEQIEALLGEGVIINIPQDKTIITK